MKDDCLLSFMSPIEFVKYINQFKIYKEWKIECGLMNDRGLLVEESDFFLHIRNLFDFKAMFRKKVSIAEMTTWLDTFIHLERLFNIMIANFSTDVLNDIEIGFEYVITMSKKSRVDCYIKYHDRVCIFEFSTVNAFSKLKSTHDKKRRELLIYKDMMLNYIEDKKIIVYPFIGLYEFENGKKKEKFIANNKNNIMYVYDFLMRFVLKK